MPSPFPGMNPYFEAPEIWEDFHQNLATEIQTQLIPQLRPKYYAALVPRVTDEEVIIQQDPRDAKPDVGVWRREPLSELAQAPVAVLPPHRLLKQSPKRRQSSYGQSRFVRLGWGHWSCPLKFCHR